MGRRFDRTRRATCGWPMRELRRAGPWLRDPTDDYQRLRDEYRKTWTPANLRSALLSPRFAG